MSTRVRDIVAERLQEKQKRNKASNQMTMMFIVTSSVIFFVFLFVWLFHSLPEVSLPQSLSYNSAPIILSSCFLVLCIYELQNDRNSRAQGMILLAILCGLIFGIVQVITLFDILNESIYRNIIFPIIVVHFLHIIIGINLLAVTYKKIRNFNIHSRKLTFANNVSLFWHFLGVIWIILLVLF